MSGIVGIYNLDGRPVEQTEIQRMLDSIAHRGPDGSGIWTNGSVGLGHQMLWTTPESLHEKLPLTNKTGELAITADARIDNRDELIPTLNLNGRPRETIPDSEIILAAYEKWGEKCPEKLLGDFVFAIWDKKKQFVFSARDHFGVKPFYYHHSEKVFAFASEIKSLLNLPGIPRRLNEVAIGYFLAWISEDKTITFYDGILRLPPGQTMTVDLGKISINSYWSLDPTRKLKLGSDREYAEAFRDIFKEAVHCRLRSAFPVGSMLSGGLDSSSIVCMARQVLSQNGGKELHTFSAIFDNLPECDERSYISSVLAKGNIIPHYLQADRVSPLGYLDNVCYCSGTALLGVNLSMYWGLYNIAKEQGVRVILDGDDGDTTVSHGLAFLRELAREGRWFSLAREIRGLSKHLSVPAQKILWHRIIKPLSPKVVRDAWRALRRLVQSSGSSNNIINSEFAKRIGLEDRFQEKRSRPIRTEREDHWFGLSSGLIPETLEMVDGIAVAFCLEPRYPFFDKRLAEFCLALPPEQKLHHGWSRMVMRRAMENVLPKDIQWRGDKSDLSPNFVHGLLTFERERLGTLVNDLNFVEPYIDLTALRNRLQRFVNNKGKEDALPIWKAITLALWLHRNGIGLEMTS